MNNTRFSTLATGSRLVVRASLLIAVAALAGCNCDPQASKTDATPATQAPTTAGTQTAPSDESRAGNRGQQRNRQAQMDRDGRQPRKGRKGRKAPQDRQRQGQAKREKRAGTFAERVPVHHYPVVAATPGGDAIRAKILATVQPVAGTDLRWTQKSCSTYTLWDSADGALKKNGASLVSQGSLHPETCKPEDRSRTMLVATHQSTDETQASTTYDAVSALAKSGEKVKLIAKTATTTPNDATAVVVQSQGRLRSEPQTLDHSTGLAKVFHSRFMPAGSSSAFQAVCGQPQLVREWVLEEVQAMPAKGQQASAGNARGKSREGRERHRSWGTLTVATNQAGTAVSHASFEMRASPKRETDAAKLALPKTVFAELKTGGLLQTSSLIDAQYRCGT